MKILKRIGRSVIGVLQQVWSFPYTLSGILKQRRERTVLKGLETERLDRIRNPSKYLGK